MMINLEMHIQILLKTIDKLKLVKLRRIHYEKEF